MDNLKRALNSGDRSLMKQYVMGIMATGGSRSTRGRDLLASGKISAMDAILEYYLPNNFTQRDVNLFIGDLKHYVGTPRRNLLQKFLGVK